MHQIGSSIEWEDLYVRFPEDRKNDLLAEWRWLVGENVQIYMVSSLGDLFLEDAKHRIHWLDTSRGHFNPIARSSGEMAKKLMDLEYLHEWFVHDLILEFHRMGKKIGPGQVYGCKIPAVCGGAYVPENFRPVDLVEHMARMGRIQRKVADLQEGATIDPAVLEL